jgi:hypothetical protein|tara:strand:+ start:310 stop:561 length:252 start_codon:yes stop_codon:yes gene_type:complete
MDKNRENSIMERMSNGKLKVGDHFPEDVRMAVETFLAASKMMVDEKLEHMPSNYLVNLLETLAKYPEYNNLTMDLCKAYSKEI